MTTRQRKAAPSKSSAQGKEGMFRKPRGKDIGYLASLKSFIGHLEGTGKAGHTISSYRFDLQSFDEYLRAQRHSKALENVRAITRKDLERFHDWLKVNGQKSNTRRRKLMTVRKLMHYLTGRKKLDLDVGKQLPAPEKIERVPMHVDGIALRRAIASLPQDSHFRLRNVALLSFLFETGAAVSEVVRLRWSAIDFEEKRVRFFGKSERDLDLPSDVLARLRKLREYSEDSDDLCFTGFNRYGPMRLGKKSLAITSRGVELLVKSLCEELGFKGVTPRTLRHSAVVDWFKAGTSESEIQKRLGLKTAYSFRIYGPIFAGIRSKSSETKSNSETTSTS